MKYTDVCAFIGRQNEMGILNRWINGQPQNMLFMYGPKSSGKTTLLYKFVKENLQNKGYDIKYVNLREILITNYKDFIQTFFKTNQSDKEDVKETRQYNLGFFKLNIEEYKGLESKQIDPFKLLKVKFQGLNSKNIRPVIIIDELQALEYIYMNGQRELLKELFNFFVAMTKESHLCHVILASSDGYFIDKIYNDSKLRKTSEFLSVDYLDRDHTYYWLRNIDKESQVTGYVLSEIQIDTIWDKLGGSPWEISVLLNALMSAAKDNKVKDKDFEEIIEKTMVEQRSIFALYSEFYKEKEELLKEINRHIKNKGYFVGRDLEGLIENGFYNRDSLKEEVINLIRNNFLALDPVKAIYTLQGRSMENGLQMFVEMIGEGKNV